jgi:predicted amidohydrolase YtcJ
LSRTNLLGRLPLLDRIEPELILYNGNIIPINDRQPRAAAVAIADGRFLAVGTNEKVQALATGKTKKINLERRTVVPGFIDAHTHPVGVGAASQLWILAGERSGLLVLESQ